MEDVSDPPFRALCKKYGADMMYTEFISSEGLIRDAVKSVQKLDIFEYERPIGIQIFGSEISSMRKATEVCQSANPDIIDINYGCSLEKVNPGQKNWTINNIPGSKPKLFVTATYPNKGGILPGIAPIKTANGVIFFNGVYIVVYVTIANKPKIKELKLISARR